ncbi:MAG TPA: rubrerythrin family protein [Flavobacteriia bacterium]|jgi:VIT1/CCC1 family predicted Fe2+/Mn2+ transporter|nr:rubrerythrin family protein [Flavobacteriia bacterium]
MSHSQHFESLKKQLQIEVDTAFLYESIAHIQTDENLKKVLEALAKIEWGHAKRVLKNIHEIKPEYSMASPSLRAKIQFKLGKVFGYESIINSLAGIEAQVGKSAIKSKLQKGEGLTGFEHNHLKIIEAVRDNEKVNVSGTILSQFEGRHKSVGGNALRAAVMGANDGLVSNMSLVMGVVGAAVSNTTVILTGTAGLLAGAISMALGEWLSVKSSRELYEYQIAIEEEELDASPEEEKKELVLIYRAKGMDEDAAQKLADKQFENKETALEALITEELGIDKEELGGSPWEAAFVSFFLFAFGAIIPLLPYFFTSGRNALYLSIISSFFGLFTIGAAITLFTGKNVFYSGFRQVLFGLSAGAITYIIGSWLGAAIV